METGLSSPPAPPGGKDQKNERVRAIIAAALEEFFQQGFAAARLDAIAERAGIGKGTIYLYFDSKETLFEEAVRSVILPVIERIESVALAPQGSAEALLRAMITTFYREVVATERRRLLRLLIAEGPRFPRLVSFYHAEVITRGYRGHAECAALWHRAGRVCPEPGDRIPANHHGTGDGRRDLEAAVRRHRSDRPGAAMRGPSRHRAARTDCAGNPVRQNIEKPR